MAPPRTEPDNAGAGLLVTTVTGALVVPEAEPPDVGCGPDEPVPEAVATYEPLLGATDGEAVDVAVMNAVDAPIADVLIEDKPFPPASAP